MKKILYNTDFEKSLSEWFCEQKTKNDCEYPVFESALGISQINKKGCSSAIGYLNADSNNLQQQNVIHMMSGICKANGNKPITNMNFWRGITTFCVRKIIKRNWLDDKDEYLAPNENHELYEQFTHDSMIVSLFHIHAYQSSLRQILYKEKLWDIKNEFFWMSKQYVFNHI